MAAIDCHFASNKDILSTKTYACEVLSFSSVQTHELDVIWNNAFRRIFNCFWRESVKPLQYFCSSLPLTWLMDERRLVFYRKAMVHSNIVIRTLMSVSGVFLTILVYVTNIKYRIHTVLLATSNTLYGVILLIMLCYRLRCVCFYFSSFMTVLLVLSFLHFAAFLA